MEVSSPRTRTANASEPRAKETGSTNSVSESLGVIVRRVNPTSTRWFLVLGLLAVGHTEPGSAC